EAVAEQILGLAELVAQTPAGSELHFVGVLGERRDRALYPRGRCRSRFERKLGGLRRRAGRALAHAGRNWRLGCEPRDQLLDLALRLARRASQDLAMVLGGEMTNEETQAGQVHLAGPQSLDDGGELPSRLGHSCPVVGRVL